jgi:hypothetical protein
MNTSGQQNKLAVPPPPKIAKLYYLEGGGLRLKPSLLHQDMLLQSSTIALSKKVKKKMFLC